MFPFRSSSLCRPHFDLPFFGPRQDAPATAHGAIAAAVPLLFCACAAALAQEGGAPTTRLLVTEVRVKPDKIADWLALERGEVVPALKKAGGKQYTVFQTLIGATNEYVIVRPLPTFAEFNGLGPLETSLG